MFSNLIGPSPYTGKVTLAAGNDRAAEEPVTAAPTGAGREALAGKLSTHTGTGITGFRAQFPGSYTIFTWGCTAKSFCSNAGVCPGGWQRREQLSM